MMANEGVYDEAQKQAAQRGVTQEAVKLVQTGPRGGEAIANSRGVERKFLYRWGRALGVRPKEVTRPAEALAPDARGELRRLRTQLAEVTEARDLLKNHVFFAKNSQ